MKKTLKSISFYQYHEYCHSIGTAELSLVDQKRKLFYFSRLYVPPKLRKKNIASNLLLRLSLWADEHHITILLDINPYGDMSLYNLIKLYKRYGFINLSKIFPNKMTRIPKCRLQKSLEIK